MHSGTMYRAGQLILTLHVIGLENIYFGSGLIVIRRKKGFKEVHML